MFIVTGYDYDDNILTLDEYLLLYQDKKNKNTFVQSWTFEVI